MEQGKPLWASKTFWVNILAAIALVVQATTGWIVSPHIQAVALTIINLILRLVTKRPIKWGNGKAALVLLVPTVALVGLTRCAGLHDAAIKRPVRLITCEYDQYVKHDPKLTDQSKQIRLRTSELLREQVHAKPCEEER